MKKFTFLSAIFVFYVLLGASPAHAAGAVTFHIRHQNDMVFEGAWTLPDPTLVSIQDKAGISHMATSTSVLAVLLDIDKANDSFAISDLAYFDSFKSFLINCITIAKGNKNACFDWHYVVNGVLPAVGADQYLLKPGDDVFFFFGTPHRVILPKDTFLRGESFVAAAQNYLYQTNGWEALPGVTIGIVRSNPDDPFTPLIAVASTADGGGKASFSLQDTGAYGIGIAEDFYFPQVNFTVVPSQVTLGGGSVASPPILPPLRHDIDAQKAIQFLILHQNPDGSFGNAALFSDWTAVAFGAYAESNSAKDALVKYLVGDPSPGNLLTDSERRAMALMALSINPYTGTTTNYIQKILDGFDGKQFGSPDLINDDVFALIPLLNAGLGEKDLAINRTVAFILSKQEPDGSWAGGVDMTSGAAQALAKTPSLDGVSAALRRAKDYLKAKQDASGGFGNNAFSTSWVMQGINALGEKSASWQRSGNTPGDYLYHLQGEDGGITLEGDTVTRLWATAYVIPAALQKPWSLILSTFSRPSLPSGQTNAGNENKSGLAPAPAESKTNSILFHTLYTFASKVRLQGDDAEEIEASLSIPEGTTGNNENGAWNKDLFLRIATSTQAIARYVEGAIDQAGTLQGFVEVEGGKNARLTFDKALTLVIPVFANEGALLDVYTRLEGEIAFHFLQTCVSSRHRCEVHPSHLSQFVALSKNDVKTKVEHGSITPAPFMRIDKTQAANTGQRRSLAPVASQEVSANRTIKKQSPASILSPVVNATLPQIQQPSAQVKGQSTSSRVLTPTNKNLALASAAKTIFPFALIATIILGAYLLRKYLA